MLIWATACWLLRVALRANSGAYQQLGGIVRNKKRKKNLAIPKISINFAAGKPKG